MPTPTQIWTFLSTVLDLYVKTGGKLVSKEVLAERYEHCKTCEHFTGRGCKLCGCCASGRKTLFNKLAYPGETCPDNPPKWKSIE